MRIIYIDSLFLINLLINYLLLLAAGKVCAVPCKRLRLLTGAALGALYAVLTILQGLEFLRHILIQLSFAVLILLCAYGGKKGLLRISLVFFLIAAAFGGIVLLISMLGGEVWTGGGFYVPLSARALFLSVGLGYAFVTILFKFMASGRGGRGAYVRLEIERAGGKVSLTALKDTGNAIRDPLTGTPVPVIEHVGISPLFPGNVNNILSDSRPDTVTERLEQLWECDNSIRFRLIPYSAVGIKSGMLLAFRPDRVILDGKELKGAWIAISPTKVSENGVYSALVSAE